MRTSDPIAYVTHMLTHGGGEYAVHVEYRYGGQVHTPAQAWRFSLN